MFLWRRGGWKEFCDHDELDDNDLFESSTDIICMFGNLVIMVHWWIFFYGIFFNIKLCVGTFILSFLCFPMQTKDKAHISLNLCYYPLSLISYITHVKSYLNANTFLSTFFSRSCTLCSSMKLRSHVSHPYKQLPYYCYILIFSVIGRRRGGKGVRTEKH